MRMTVRKKIGKQALIDLVQKRMRGVRMDAPCDGCVLRNVVRRESVGDASNWLPVQAGGCSPDCERRLNALLMHLSDEYDVIFPER